MAVRPSELDRTEEVVQEATLRDLYCENPDDRDEVVPDRIETHDGAWVREPLGWRWWRVADDEE